jgi:hypothetical protein
MGTLIAILLLLSPAPRAAASTLAKSYTFSSGTVASASEINGDFDQLFTESNSQDTRITALENGTTNWTVGGGLLYYTGGNVGVGTTSPSSKFHSYDSRTDTTNATFTSNYFEAPVSPAGASSSTFIDLYTRQNVSGSSNVSSVEGIRNYMVNSNTGTIASMGNTNYYILNNSTGTISNAIGVNMLIENASTGTVSGATAGLFELRQDSSGQIGGTAIVSEIRNHSSSAMPSSVATSNLVLNDSGGSMGSATASIGEIQNTGAGSITTAYGVRSKLTNSGGGTVTNAYGIMSEYNNSSGAVSNWYGIYVPAISGTAPTTARFPLYVADTGTSYIAGSLGIGTPSTSYLLDVNGTIRGFGITDASDLRLKKDVRDLGASLERIRKLRGVTFRWKDAHRDQGEQIGLVAQEVEKEFPSLVSTDAQGLKSVNYSHMVAPLLEAVKELSEENQSLRDYLCAKDPGAPFCHK